MAIPAFTIEQAAVRMGVPVEVLRRFIEEETSSLLAEGAAHFDENGVLIIDGGES